MSLGLPMGRQVTEKVLSQVTPQGSCQERLTEGPGSLSQDQGTQTGKTHGHPLGEWGVADCQAFHGLPRPRPPWLTQSDRSALERSGDVKGTDLPLDAGLGAAQRTVQSRGE